MDAAKRREIDRRPGERVDVSDPYRVQQRFVRVFRTKSTKHGIDHLTWEQYFSYDGKTWEMNWTADLVRGDAAACVDGRPKT